MQQTSSADGCSVWLVNGKVKPAYRGFGSSVKLLCQKYDSIGTGQNILTFPNDCESPPCAAQADACGNFAFNAKICGPSPQLDNTFFCTFVVHVDGEATPSACNSPTAPPDSPPADPNGTAPCSGGFCPNAP